MIIRNIIMYKTHMLCSAGLSRIIIKSMERNSRLRSGVAAPGCSPSPHYVFEGISFIINPFTDTWVRKRHRESINRLVGREKYFGCLHKHQESERYYLNLFTIEEIHICLLKRNLKREGKNIININTYG